MSAWQSCLNILTNSISAALVIQTVIALSTLNPSSMITSFAFASIRTWRIEAVRIYIAVVRTFLTLVYVTTDTSEHSEARKTSTFKIPNFINASRTGQAASILIAFVDVDALRICIFLESSFTLAFEATNGVSALRIRSSSVVAQIWVFSSLKK